MEQLYKSYTGSYTNKEFLHNAEYCYTATEIKNKLDSLHQYAELTLDIETWGLGLVDAGIATVAISWNEHEGVGFPVDYTVDGEIGSPNIEKRKILKDFIDTYTGKLIYHNARFDIKQLVANLFMDNDLLDYRNMVDGLEVMCENHYCTKDMAYLATNSTEGNDLSLKHLTKEFTGEYAIDVTDITKHTLSTILEYNIKDSCATFWLYKKLLPILHKRNQYNVYMNEFRPNNRMILGVELHGMPMDIEEVLNLGEELTKDTDKAVAILNTLHCVERFIEYKTIEDHRKYQSKIKGKGRTLENYAAWKPIEFKAGSSNHIIWILHQYFNLPVVETTDTGLPSTSGDTLKIHLNTLKENNGDTEAIQFIEALLVYVKVTKIYDFVKAFLTYSIRKSDGIYYLHGNFNQGSTISTRLSSNSPNLQNMPSQGKYGKAIKKCFIAPKDKIFLSSDYAALEDRIGTLLSKDPNMLRVYTDGYDGHCLRTLRYFPDEVPKITQWLGEVNMEGNLYKITYDDGSFEYLNEHNPKLKELQNEI
jgi:DNA polymerase-1